MMPAKEWRIGWLAASLMICLLGGWGCKPSSRTDGKKPPVLNVKAPAESGGAGQSKSTPSGPQPQEFAGNFLKAIGEQTATADQLTASFKKKIARPDPKDEAQRKLGFNPRKVEEFLAKAGAGKPDIDLRMGPSLASPYFFGQMKTSGGMVEQCLIRVVPSSDPAGWQVDWFQRVGAVGPELDVISVEPEIAVHQFLGNLLGGDLTLAEAVMNSSLKQDLAWSATESDKEQGYNSKLLQQKMGDWKKGLIEFTIAKRDIRPGMPAHFEGDLLDATRKEKKSYALTMIQAAGGDWQVQEFKIH